MTRAIVLLAVVAGCGGEGKCAQPPCDVPPLPCTSDADCFQTEFCDFEMNSCGRDPLDVGICGQRPTACMSSTGLSCGCDGKYHDNPCGAAGDGTDLAESGCTAPPGFFACGDTACEIETQMCSEFSSGASRFFMCEDFPLQCRNDHSCACLEPFGCPECTESPGTVTRKCMLFPEED
jgi:hypothetical protein